LERGKELARARYWGGGDSRGQMAAALWHAHTPFWRHLDEAAAVLDVRVAVDVGMDTVLLKEGDAGDDPGSMDAGSWGVVESIGWVGAQSGSLV